MKLNFRDKLLAICIPALVVMIALLTAIVYFSATNTVFTVFGDDTERLIHSIEKQLDNWLEDVESKAQVFAANEVFIAAAQGQQTAEARSRLEKLHSYYAIYENVFVANAGGEILVDSIGGASVGVNISQLPDYQINAEKAGQGQVWIGGAKKSPATGRPVSLVTAPIYEGSRIVGIMGTPIEVNQFSKVFLADIVLGESGYIYMTDSDGIIIAHPNPELILEMDLHDYEWGTELLQNEKGKVPYVFQGVSKTVYFTSSQKVGWKIAGTMNDSDLSSMVSGIGFIGLVMGILTVLIVSGAIWMVSTTVYRGVSKAASSISSGSTEVFNAANQVSTSSQELAAGASDQASSIEQVSASLEQLSASTKQNADNANQASALASSSRDAFIKGRETIERLVTKIGNLKDSSDQMAKIIKTIDEIAFQTNLLALNAAVEAARAGEAGKGFAVVAEEVRNLAQRSAEAAKNTASLIEESQQNTEEGVHVTEEVNETLADVLGSAEKLTTLIDEVNEASNEQAQGIMQITTAINKLEEGTQANAASAEESAAASEELNAQAAEMNQLARRMSEVIGLKQEGGRGPTLKAETRKAIQPPKQQPQREKRAQKLIKPESVIPLDDDDF